MYHIQGMERKLVILFRKIYFNFQLSFYLFYYKLEDGNFIRSFTPYTLDYAACDVM